MRAPEYICLASATSIMTVGAMEYDLRIIGVDRPGIGSSTPHVYDNVLDFATDPRRQCGWIGFERDPQLLDVLLNDRDCVLEKVG